MILSFQGGKTNEQLEGVAMTHTEVSSNLEQPFDFGIYKSVRGRYSLILEDMSRVNIVLYPDQSGIPVGRFNFYIDTALLAFFGSSEPSTYVDIPGDGVVLDHLLPRGTLVVGGLRLVSISYVPVR